MDERGAAAPALSALGTMSVVCGDVFEAPLPLGEARLVIADPPYTDVDYFNYGTVPSWGALVKRMVELGAEDAVYVIHMGSTNLSAALPAVEEHGPKRRRRSGANLNGGPKARILVWTKPWGAWRPNVAFQYGWEPIVVFYGPKFRHPKAALATAETDWICLPPQKPATWIVDGREVTHPTQKPEQLLVWLLDRLAVGGAGRSAVDLFAGSGTGAVMAGRFGMDAVAVERDEDYAAAIALRWAAETEGRLPRIDSLGEQQTLIDVERVQTGDSTFPSGTARVRVRNRKRGGPTQRVHEVRTRRGHGSADVP